MTNSDCARALFAALDAKKWDKASECLTSDFKFYGPMSTPLNKNEFIGFQRAIHEALPDFDHHAAVSREGAAGEVYGTVQVAGTQNNALEMPMIPKLPATGKTVSLPRENWTIQMAKGKIKSLTVDVPPDGGFLSLLRQIGYNDVADCLKSKGDCQSLEIKPPAGAGAFSR